jgi:hypothetical protein
LDPNLLSFFILASLFLSSFCPRGLGLAVRVHSSEPSTVLRLFVRADRWTGFVLVNPRAPTALGERQNEIAWPGMGGVFLKRQK